MGKYSYQVKLAAVRDYCRGQAGLKQVARHRRVNVASLRNWVAVYRVHGAPALRTKARDYYSAKFKLGVLQRIDREMLSHRQAGVLFNIRNRDMIGLWARAYEAGGFAALEPYSTKRRAQMVSQVDIGSKANEIEDEGRSRQELLDELRQLRMENAYLKKLEALAQANQQPARGKRPK
jgi:transposase